MNLGNAASDTSEAKKQHFSTGGRGCRALHFLYRRAMAKAPSPTVQCLDSAVVSCSPAAAAVSVRLSQGSERQLPGCRATCTRAEARAASPRRF
ncbi:hypothetical protein SKAU_G00013920 [Synaphobranchus kaupii]|uniref:Uncharacterized protein n=1 Tax=Synaphobranchus kaupii TaxID=118154 RepID=A0A9Q1GAK6_SYNKA|nr:hypothetical protein SKAU_G00013920 [Synaphobranchus kaupii]